jgi:hypothetical protein
MPLTEQSPDQSNWEELQIYSPPRNQSQTIGINVSLEQKTNWISMKEIMQSLLANSDKLQDFLLCKNKARVHI